LPVFSFKFAGMKRFTSLFILMLSLLLASTQPAQAQFWKKIFGKEEKRKPRKPKQEPPARKEEHQEKRLKEKKAPQYPESYKRESYRVDVLLPLHLGQLVKDGKPAYTKYIPETSLAGINFYEGVAIACDTLKDSNIKLDVYIHDIFDEAGNIAYLIANHIIDSSDLIIGALQSGDIEPVAHFAKEKKINFISALSPADAGIKDNPYFILIQPTLYTHIQQLTAFSKKRYTDAPRYILYRDNKNEEEGYRQLQQLLEKDKVKEIKCTGEPDAFTFKNTFDSTRKNVLYVTFLETGYAEKLLKLLAVRFPGYRFEVMGMPSWKSIYSITQTGNYPNMDIYFTTPFFFDPTTGPGSFIGNEYKKYSLLKPSEMVYRGYESVYWLSHLLHRYGRYFNQQVTDVNTAQFTRYNVEPRYSDENDFLYLENKKLYIYHYSDGNYSVE